MVGLVFFLLSMFPWLMQAVLQCQRNECPVTANSMLQLKEHAQAATWEDSLVLGNDSTFGESPGTLSAASLQNCSFELIMLDTRDPFTGDRYLSKTAVINYAYAKKHGYAFTFVTLDPSRKLSDYETQWHKVFYFSENWFQQLENKRGRECTWAMLIDSDAFVKEFDKPLQRFIADMASKYGISNDVGAIFGQEQNHPPELQNTWHHINTGVWLVQANARGRHLFETWRCAASDDRRLKQEWSREQGVLTELIFPGKYPAFQGHFAELKKHDDVSADVALISMAEMNSPWGEFVAHVWGGPGRQLRKHVYDEMLQRIGIRQAHFRPLLEEVRKNAKSWVPHDPNEGCL